MSYTFALLYSNTPLNNTKDQSFFESTKKVIQNDIVLSKSIHLVCIDNLYTRNLLKSNGILNWPVFIIKHPNLTPKVYKISEYRTVFDEVQNKHKEFTQTNTKDWPVINWNVKDFTQPQDLYVSVGDSVKFKSTDNKPHTLIEDSPNPRVNYNISNRNFDKLVKFNDAGIYKLISDDYNNMIVNVYVCQHKVIWNLGEGIKELKVNYNDMILFESNDNNPHNIWFANKNWKPMSQIVKLQKNMKEVIKVNRKTFAVPASYHLISSKYQDPKLRIIVNDDKPHAVRSFHLNDEEDDDIFDQIEDYSPKNRFREDKGEELIVSPDIQKIIGDAIKSHFNKQIYSPISLHNQEEEVLNQEEVLKEEVLNQEEVLKEEVLKEEELNQEEVLNQEVLNQEEELNQEVLNQEKVLNQEEVLNQEFF